MPTKEQWTEVYTDLMARLGLPCKLRFTEYVSVGMHDWEDDLSECFIEINLRADFRVPEHLIMHEAAHHRVLSPSMHGFSRYDAYNTAISNGGCLHSMSQGHCKHWAKTLHDMYKEVGIPLPKTTGFKAFARTAGIAHKVFSKDKGTQMWLVSQNPRLVEGA